MSALNQTKQEQPVLSQKSLKLLEDFRQQSGVEEEHYRNLVASINASPMMVERFNAAVEGGNLLGLKALPSESNMGGSFSPDSKEISLPLTMLTDDLHRTIPAIQNEVIFVLAHEVQHSFNHQAMEQARQKFLADIDKQAAAKAPRDYTDELDTYIRATRWDEASAEIAGYNAVVSKAKLQTTVPTPQSLYEMANQSMESFIDEDSSTDPPIYRLKNGFQPNPDMTLSDSKDKPNLETIARNYYDKDKEETKLASYCPPEGCSPNDYVDYTNYYAAWMVGEVIDAERRHNPKSSEPFTLNMNKLKLSEEMLEENGLYITGGKPMNYRNIGITPPVDGRFDHTYDGRNHHTWVPAQESRTAQTDSTQSRAEAILQRYRKTLDALESGDRRSEEEARREMREANPAAGQLINRIDTELGLRALHREQENRRYSLANMPERARTLHAQIEEKLTAYYQEHNIPHTAYGLKNSITALTAEAYANKLPSIGDLTVTPDGRLGVAHKKDFILHTVFVDAEQAPLITERDSFKDILQSEQVLAREAEQRELERQMEHSRSMGMSR